MRRIICIFLSCFLFVITAACGNTAAKPSPTQTAGVSPSIIPSAVPSPTPTAALGSVDDIKVTYELDSTLSQAIVFVKNTGTYTFTGDIHVYFYDSERKKVGYDMLIIKDLTAGNSTYVRIKLSKTTGLSIKYDFASGYKFTKGTSSSGGVIDDTISKELITVMNENFGNAYGNPTSWYKYIIKIEVYKATGYNYAVITVNTTDKESVDRIGNTVFGNYLKKYNLSRVTVLNNAGAKLFERAAQ